MSYADELAPHLPYLRRYARALTGSQASGDAHVRAALEAAVADQAALDRSLPPRIALYQLFHAIWSSAASRLEDGTANDSGLGAEERLRRLSPVSRQALLLTAMEGFSTREAATILRLPEDQAQSLVADAQREIDSVLATDVLVIEDEPIIAADLQNIVRELGHNVLGVARTRTQAVAAAKASAPGLVLADIHLADDSSGIDAVQDILQEHDCPVIFITAFPERLLTGKRPEPTFLITKPFMADAVKAAIGQALFFA